MTFVNYEERVLRRREAMAASRGPRVIGMGLNAILGLAIGLTGPVPEWIDPNRIGFLIGSVVGGLLFDIVLIGGVCTAMIWLLITKVVVQAGHRRYIDGYAMPLLGAFALGAIVAEAGRMALFVSLAGG